jgi:hypothetical protein
LGNSNHYSTRHPSSWSDADKANYLADDIEINGIESATSAFDPWEADIYIRALRVFANMQES